jgi:uncharacterized protein YcaQ
MPAIHISKLTARRFVLGRQGLWPGRRWKGRRGTAQALLACEAVQEDPLAVAARSHDIVLHSRVLDYKPEYLDQVMYAQRGFFDYGGGLHIYPMSELPYWRLHMQRRSHEKRVEDYVFTHDQLFEQVRARLRAEGPLGNRDFEGNAVPGNYRGSKDTALALFDMWLSGELMIHHRDRFHRLYDFRENIAPPEFSHAAAEKDSEEFFGRKIIALMGFIREGGWATMLGYYIRRKVSPAEARAWLDRWMEQGLIASLQVEGWKDKFLVLGEDVLTLDLLEAGKIPRSWRTIGPTTDEEVTLLAPLDVVSARSRSNKLFDFEYLWEVYKPAAQRRWGYYTLPILYGDNLVARLDPRLDRASGTLQIRGFWHENHAPVREAGFAQALGRGLARFAGLLGATRINIAAIHPPALRKRLGPVLGDSLSVSTQALD